MVSAIFTSEISNLENQVAQLQAQIAAAQSRIAALGEAEFVASGALQAVQEAVAKISGLAPSAIAALKKSVLTLFDSNDGDQGSEQPVADGPLWDPLLNGQTCEIDPMCHWETAQPDGTSWEWATPLCCLVEDAPLMGQFTELTCATTSNVVPSYEVSTEAKPAIIEPVSISKTGDNAEAQDVFQLVNLTPSVAYCKRIDNGKISATYVGANNKQNLKRWGEFLTLTHSVGNKFEFRESKRLSGCKWELKLWGLSLAQIEKLSTCDVEKDPRKCLTDALVRKAERVPTTIELDGYQPGDVARSVTVRNWTYTVLGVRDNGFLEVERIGTNPAIRSTLSPASVELVRRGGVVEVAAQEVAADLDQQAQDAVDSIQPPVYPLIHQGASIDVDDVTAGVRLTPGRDDLLVQFEVWMQVEVRVMGRSQQQQKQIGVLTETLLGIEAIRPRGTTGKTFNRTLDAVAYLVSGSGLKPVTQALVGVGVSDASDEF